MRPQRQRAVDQDEADQHRENLQAEQRVQLTEAQKVRPVELLSPAEVLRFQELYECFVAAARTADLYGAGSLMNGSLRSDGTFLYFRNWLVAQGREVNLVHRDVERVP